MQEPSFGKIRDGHVFFFCVCVCVCVCVELTWNDPKETFCDLFSVTFFVLFFLFT